MKVSRTSANFGIKKQHIFEIPFLNQIPGNRRKQNILRKCSSKANTSQVINAVSVCIETCQKSCINSNARALSPKRQKLSG
jgi:hypothetical protein